MYLSRSTNTFFLVILTLYLTFFTFFSKYLVVWLLWYSVVARWAVVVCRCDCGPSVCICAVYSSVLWSSRCKRCVWSPYDLRNQCISFTSHRGSSVCDPSKTRLMSRWMYWMQFSSLPSIHSTKRPLMTRLWISPGMCAASRDASTRAMREMSTRVSSISPVSVLQRSLGSNQRFSVILMNSESKPQYICYVTVSAFIQTLLFSVYVVTWACVCCWSSPQLKMWSAQPMNFISFSFLGPG